MAFAMKGGSRVPLRFFEEKIVYNHLESLPECYNEVTMNMAKYGSRRSQQPENVNFEPIIRGLKSDIFD